MAAPIIAIDATLVCGSSTGDSSYWTGLVRALLDVTDCGFRFLLLSDAESPPFVLPNRAKAQWLHLPGKRGRLFSLITMPLAARRRGAVAYHTQYNLSPLAKNGITTIHDVSFFIGPHWFKPRDRFFLSKFVPLSARRARKVITVSETSKQDILRFISIPAAKITVTPLAPGPEFAPVEPDLAAKVLQRMNIQPPYILSVGTRWPRKNLQLAYDAVNMLPKSLPHRLVVTGKTGWGREEPGPKVVHVGYVPAEDLPALYSAADLYLCPSHYEGFGLPIVEAFACGTPVITAPGGALPETAGDAAVVMHDMSPEAWAARIQTLLADSSILTDLRERGLRRAAKFSWAETARRTLDVYREVAF